MLSDYGYVGLLLIVAVIFTLLMPLIPWLLSLIGLTPHHPNRVKNSTYECGMEPIGQSWIQFNFRYYFFALAFVIFDVLIVFLFPWAILARDLGVLGFAAIFGLITILAFGYVYAWKKRVLEWK